MIKLVAFDLDGTIGDTIPMCLKALKKAVTPYVTAFCIPGSIPFFYPDGKYRIFKFLSLFRLHPVMCAKLLFHTGDWNCQTAEKQ